MTKYKHYDTAVPLFLIATAVAEGIRKRGGKLYRISVVRTHSHAYRIRYKCRVKEVSAPKIRPVLRECDLGQWTLSAYGVADTGEILTKPMTRENGVRYHERTGE